ncbi:ABC transporter ATP-binding protein [Vallitalea guaymasensis]|uniref:ATP-binding cassette domain-containing protein n=1 Tax=Vallitalea guaymasensis TaxID=1185412 RepID=A0A8J8M826_9FIRM|nr:ATP-binding cassette domain-containing protein [Vallitalea guaymasensis]QUH27928.1 ATP-binding cassette domain-containing protein [Vallitalea guaymasensis]
MSLLKIDNLEVEVDGKKVLDKLNLEMGKGETHVLLGPNASGKSTLLCTLLGFSKYKIKGGKILFKDEDISDIEIEERAQRGMAAVYQNPPAINVKLSKLLDKIRKKNVKIEGIESLMQRDVNIGFSGGERKFSEVIQVISLDPDLIILDELDAGLDVENLERLCLLIKEQLNDKTILLITHRGKALNYFKPDYAHVMLDGKITCSSKDWEKIWRLIEENGYEKCKTCKLSSAR